MQRTSNFKFDLQRHGGVTKFIGNLFGVKKAQQSTPTQLTGRDILSSTFSAIPDSPLLGSSEEDDTLLTGKDSVKVALHSNATQQKEPYKSKLYA